MSRLASFVTALWVSSAAANPGFSSDIPSKASSGLNIAKNVAVNEVQGALNPLGQSIALIGGGLCPGVKQIVGVEYEDYQGNEPDMSQLTLFYSTDSKTVYYKLAKAAVEIPKERWWNRKLVIYLHGFTDNPTKSSFQTMLAAFRSIDDINILALDASSLIKFFYLRSSTMVRYIGEYFAAVLAALIPAGLEPQNIHLMGHSLGSHIAGFTGKTFRKLTGTRLGRISSMDPAGPCFSKLDDLPRLSKHDAHFVDVIHSDAGVYGMDHSIGHVDFWVNGGSQQPNCLFQTCSHSRAWEYFAESVTNKEGFPAVQCDSYYDFSKGECNFDDTSFMGYACPNTTRGDYFLSTFGDSPYASGSKGLSYQNTALTKQITLEAKNIISSAVADLPVG